MRLQRKHANSKKRKRMREGRWKTPLEKRLVVSHFSPRVFCSVHISFPPTPTPSSYMNKVRLLRASGSIRGHWLSPLDRCGSRAEISGVIESRGTLRNGPQPHTDFTTAGSPRGHDSSLHSRTTLQRDSVGDACQIRGKRDIEQVEGCVLASH